MFESCLFFTLNSFTRGLNRLWEGEFSKLGLSASHGYLLRVVLETPGVTQKEAADQLDLAPSTVTRFVDALEKKELVKRSCCSEDARAMKIFPTKRGEALRKRIDQALITLRSQLFERLGENELKELVKMIKLNRPRLDGR